MRFEEWLQTIPEEITNDSLWKAEVYRLALYASDLVWEDFNSLIKDTRMTGPADQLLRAVCSISANIAEGYSRGTGKGRAIFYEYALGSARESRDWYYKCRYGLDEEIIANRFQLLTRIIRLLLKMVPQQRGYRIGEEEVQYQNASD